ncbi:unnamed protein product, partial [Didymodactylos carnosus]
PPKTLDETTYFYVDTIDKLNNMMDHLKEQQELAVDCELSFISSLHLEELHVLNTVFANPKILKVSRNTK